MESLKHWTNHTTASVPLPWRPRIVAKTAACRRDVLKSTQRLLAHAPPCIRHTPSPYVHTHNQTVRSLHWLFINAVHLLVGALQCINVGHFSFAWFYFVTFFFCCFCWREQLEFSPKTNWIKVIMQNYVFSIVIFFHFPKSLPKKLSTWSHLLHEKPVDSRVAVYMITNWLNQTLTVIKTFLNIGLMMSLQHLKWNPSILHVLVCVQGFILRLFHAWGYNQCFRLSHRESLGNTLTRIALCRENDSSHTAACVSWCFFAFFEKGLILFGSTLVLGIACMWVTRVTPALCGRSVRRLCDQFGSV